MKKLVFIDDSPMDHFILKRILSKYQLDYDVTCTTNGAEVVGFLERNMQDFANLPDVILLDLYMPGFDGWDFLDKVQHLYPHLAKPLRIYILSSSINPRDIEQAKQYACVRSFIFKPITREVLEKHINEESSTA
ncbi:MAG TPA: response regulator [Mucilaginibacter sp.]|nr:response regulator [Mucilaginibacter sp.]